MDYQDGLEYFNHGDYHKAKNSLERISEQDNDFARSEFLLGIISFRENNLKDAFLRFNVALKLFTGDLSEILYYLGLVLERMELFCFARRQFEKVIETNSNYELAKKKIIQYTNDIKANDSQLYNNYRILKDSITEYITNGLSGENSIKLNIDETIRDLDKNMISTLDSIITSSMQSFSEKQYFKALDYILPLLKNCLDPMSKKASNYHIQKLKKMKSQALGIAGLSYFYSNQSQESVLYLMQYEQQADANKIEYMREPVIDALQAMLKESTNPKDREYARQYRDEIIESKRKDPEQRAEKIKQLGLRDPGAKLCEGHRRFRSFAGRILILLPFIGPWTVLYDELMKNSLREQEYFLFFLPLTLLLPLCFLVVVLQSFATRYVFYERRIDLYRGILFRKVDSIWLFHVLNVNYRRGPINFLTNDAKVEIVADIVSDLGPPGSRGKIITITGMRSSKYGLKGNKKDMYAFFEEIRDAAIVERRGMKNWFI